MESQTTYQLTNQEISKMIDEGMLCPYPRGYKPHDYNAGAIEKVADMSPEQRREWLRQAREKRLALQARVTTP
jgi:hypothetical protein